MIDAYESECPATQRSGQLDNDWMATVMLNYAHEDEDTCCPVTLRAPYTMAVLSAEMGG